MAAGIFKFGEVLSTSLARLVDIAPTSIAVLDESDDWALVGGDLREAIERVTAEEPVSQPASSTDDEDELAEA